MISGGLQTWKGYIPVGTYSFLVFITQRLLWPLTTLGHILDDYQRSMASTNRVLDLIDTPIKIKTGKVKLDPSKLQGNITFKNIDFSYEDRPPTLENFNLSIKSGQKIGIVGTTGSGKSTLVKLLLRLYEINNGSIEIDKKSIASLDLNSLRRCIALVSQETYLFHGTIEENIAYGSGNIDNNKIIKSINNTNFETLKKLELKDGFDEKGFNSFFRKGIVGDWKENLNPLIAKKIEETFESEMLELGYL